MACTRQDGQPGRRTARQIAGHQAEEVVADRLAASGWTILARNVRIGRAELDIVALDPESTPVIVEVRSRSGPEFGAAEESVDGDKVRRLYTAGWQLLRAGGLPDGRRLPARDLPARDLPARDLPARDLPARALPARALPVPVLHSAALRVDLVVVERTDASAAWSITEHLHGLDLT